MFLGRASSRRLGRLLRPLGGERVVVSLLHWDLKVIIRRLQGRNPSWEGRNDVYSAPQEAGFVA